MLPHHGRIDAIYIHVNVSKPKSAGVKLGTMVALYRDDRLEFCRITFAG
jgi:hypothetical protein